MFPLGEFATGLPVAAVGAVVLLACDGPPENGANIAAATIKFLPRNERSFTLSNRFLRAS